MRGTFLTSISIYLTSSAAILAAQDDPVRAKLDEAIASFRSKVEKAEKDLRTKLQGKVEEAQRKGDREAFLRASKEKEDFEAKGVLPEGVSTKEYSRAMRALLQTLNAAFEEAIKKYTQAGQDSRAEELGAEIGTYWEKFGTAAAVEMEPEESNQKGQDALDSWGRWHKFPGGNKVGPRCVMWQDEEGWHVRVLTVSKLRRFEGAIRVVGGRLSTVAGLDGLEPRGKTKDTIRWNEARNQLSFCLVCKGDEDGFDFRLTRNASKLRCVVKMDGYDHPETIFIGTQGQHPKLSDFSLAVKLPKAREEKR